MPLLERASRTEYLRYTLGKM